MKTFILIIGLIIILATSAFAFSKLLPKNASGTNVSPLADQSTPSNSPLPSPTTAITSTSNLSDELNKLTVPEFSDDYKNLDKTLSNF